MRSAVAGAAKWNMTGTEGSPGKCPRRCPWPHLESIWLSEVHDGPDLHVHPDIQHLGCNVAEGEVADQHLLLFSGVREAAVPGHRPGRPRDLEHKRGAVTQGASSSRGGGLSFNKRYEEPTISILMFFFLQCIRCCKVLAHP